MRYALLVLVCFVFAPLVLCSGEQGRISCEKFNGGPFIKRGCRIDTERDLTTLHDVRNTSNLEIVRLGKFNYFHKLACKCSEHARRLGNKFFAIEKFGLCMSGPGSIDQFLKNYPLDKNESCYGVVPQNNKVVSARTGEICFGGNMRAFFYEIAKPSQPASAEGKEEETTACRQASDIVFAVDSSGSVGEDNFIRCKEFLKKLSDRFDIGKWPLHASRLGLLSFDHHVKLKLTWLESQRLTKGQIKDKIDALPYTQGYTATDLALKTIKEKIIDPGNRNVTTTIFVITDGKSFQGQRRLPGPIKALRAYKSVRIITIGIGSGVDINELYSISGDMKRVFLYNSFKSIVDHATKVLNDLVSKSCI